MRRIALPAAAILSALALAIFLWLRRLGRNGLSVRFEPGERLKTGGSCGEGGAVFMGAEREARSLEVKAQSCKN